MNEAKNHSNRSEETAKLLEKRRELEDELKKIDHQLKVNVREERVRSQRGRPVRAVVLDVLEELGTIAYTREVSLYVKARYGQDIASSRFGTLSTDEKKAFGSERSRPVSLCHGLTSERFEAIKRLWGRSDWPLWKRIVAPTTGRVQHLQMTVRLCEIAMEVESAVDPDSLKIVAADHARALPGIKFQRGKFDLRGWKELAESELVKWQGQDEGLRKAAAAKLEQYGEHVQLFGLDERMLSSLPDPEELKVQEG